mmetsp:Transcript_13674/g.50964  ORF Transcript_13674/g.50964 Transcript_13674/m.50964 type:complete len:216 (-) Transcript_13674:67-714(-)|eukprot:scaffold7624_cov248-Pinguiococcus_pyrenoidosus.AAC.12
MVHQRPLVQLSPDAVSAEVRDDAVPIGIRHVRHGLPDVRQAGARPHRPDGLLQRLLRGVAETPSLRVGLRLSHDDRGAVVAVVAVQEQRHVEAHHVPAPQGPVVRDAVARHVVHAAAQRLGEAHVVQGRGIRPRLADAGVHHRIDLVRGAALHRQAARQVQHLARQAPCGRQALQRLWTMQNDVLGGALGLAGQGVGRLWDPFWHRPRRDPSAQF